MLEVRSPPNTCSHVFLLTYNTQEVLHILFAK